MAEIVPHIELGDVADGAGQLNPGRAAADDDEIEHGMGAGFHHLPLRQLKGQQHAAPDFRRILDGLQAWCILRPVIVAKVGVGRASAQDQVVIGDLRARAQQQARLSASMPIHLVHQYFDIRFFDKMERMGWAISAGERTASATW